MTCLSRAFLGRPAKRLLAFERHSRLASSTAASNPSSVGTSSEQSGYSFKVVAAAAAAGVLGGVAMSSEDARLRKMVLPDQSFRLCCDPPTTEAQKALPQKLEAIVGKGKVSNNVTLRGSMSGKGTALALVNPGTLREAIEVLRACVAADVAIIPQGANTGITGGSVPRDAECDRPTVVINMRRLNKILPIGPDGEQVLCFAGAGIFDLQERLKNEYSRDSHSVLGSIFLNPSVGAGVSFGSGGTQIRKGPVFTERALFCRVTKEGDIELVNTLGLKDADKALSFLEERNALTSEDMDTKCKRPASWPKYAEHVTRFDKAVSRYNADTTGIDCNRSEGKVMILATIHDTYPLPKSTKLVWVSCKDFSIATALKRQVCLTSPDCMAKTCEYIDREQFDCIDQAGRVLIKSIEMAGMANLGHLWNLKLAVANLPLPFSGVICDKVLWWFNGLLPESLPKPLMDLGRAYDHHLLIELSEYSDGEVAKLESLLQKFMASQPEGSVKHHVCEDAFEKSRAMLFRFAVQPSIVTYCVGKGLQCLIIDYAMPKNFTEAFTLPPEYTVEKRCRCAHFGCNVYHEALAFGPDVDMNKAKYAIKAAIEKSGGRLPAEHGHGTDYAAPKDTHERWMRMDPTNTLNPGVGGLSYYKNYSATPCHLCSS